MADYKMGYEMEAFIDECYEKALYESNQAEKLAKHSKGLNDKYLYWRGLTKSLRRLYYNLEYINRELKRKGIAW